MTDTDLEERVRHLLDIADVDDQFAFRGAQYDAGLAWVHFPVGRGGLGLSRSRQALVDDMLRDAGVPYHDLLVNPIGIGMAAPTLLAYGSSAVHDRYLRPIFTGEEIWCQLFSEPGSGSDIAGLPGRAVRDGDVWVVNGQKVWTTLAHVARFGMLLIRTDPSVPKHAGLSYFVLDMSLPGVDVRPLYQMTGEAEFNEVFLSDVRVAADCLLGEEGEGWKVATTTLLNERVALGGGRAGRGGGPIRSLVNQWHRRREELPSQSRAVYRDRVSSLWIRAEVLRLTNQRARAVAATDAAGPAGSVGKLMSAELNQEVFDACVDLLGADGLVHEPGYPMTRPAEAMAHEGLTGQFLRSRANTIEGGTSEIMRNIIGERVLALPRDVRTDTGVPWSSVPR